MPTAAMTQNATAAQKTVSRVEGDLVQPTRHIAYGSYSTAFSFRAVSGDVEPTALRWTMPQRPLPRLRGRDREGARNDRAFPPPHPPPPAGEGAYRGRCSRLLSFQMSTPAPFCCVWGWSVRIAF